MKEMTALDASRVAELVRKVWKAFDLVRGNIPSSDFHVILFVLSLVKDRLINRELLREDAILNYIQEIGNSEKYRLIWPHYERLVTAVTDPILVRLFDYLLSIDREALENYFPEIFDGILEVISDSEGKRGNFWMMPKEISELASHFIPKKPGISIFNPFAGTCTFALELPSDASYYGQELNASARALGQLRLLAHGLDNRAELRLEDSLHYWPTEKKYDCILSSPPFGLRRSTNSGEWMNSQYNRIEEFALEQASESLAPNGVAIIVLPVSILFSSSQQSVVLRRKLTESGVLRWVVTLPSGIYANTGIKTVAIVLVNDGNLDAGISLVDGTDCVLVRNVKNRLLDVEAVLTLIQDAPENKVITIGLEELEQSDFHLDPMRYLPLLTEEAQALQYDTIELREIVTACGDRVQSGTGKLLRIGDLHSAGSLLPMNIDGVEVSSFSKPAKKIQGEVLMVATTGKELKPTFLQSETVVYVSNGVFPMSVDRTKVSPMFLVHQLNGAYATAQITRLLQGATIPHLRVSDLMSIRVELPTIEVQEKLLLNYKAQLLESRQRSLDEMSEQLGLNKADENSQIRHQIAGPLRNSRHSLSSIKRIIVEQNTGLINLSLEGKTTTLGEYLNRLERDLGKMQRSVITAGQTIEMLDLTKEKLDIIAFTRSYTKELKERVSGRYEVNFWFDEESLGQEDLDAVYVKGDPDFLTQIFDNLVANAEKHAFAEVENPRHELDISILFNFDGAKVQVDFSNTGLPFPKNLKWSNAIRKGGAFGTSAGDGTGLWLVNELMERHGGSLDFTDETGSDGIHSNLVSTFELYFPIEID